MFRGVLTTIYLMSFLLSIFISCSVFLFINTDLLVLINRPQFSENSHVIVLYLFCNNKNNLKNSACLSDLSYNFPLKHSWLNK